MKQSNKDIYQCQCWKSVALLYINDQSEKGNEENSFVYNCFRKNKLFRD